MKAINDKIVSEHLWYLCLAYLDDTNWKIVEEMGLFKTDKDGWPVFKLESVNYEQFQKIVNAATKYFMDKSVELTLDNIDKYVEK